MAASSSNFSSCGLCPADTSSDTENRRLFPDSEFIKCSQVVQSCGFQPDPERSQCSDPGKKVDATECTATPVLPIAALIPDGEIGSNNEEAGPNNDEDRQWSSQLLCPYRETYTFLEHFGIGGQGSLLKMANEQGQVVAVKVMRSSTSLSAATREIAALKVVSECPNVVQMLSSMTGSADDPSTELLANIVMRFCSGGDLLHLNHRRCLARDQMPEYWLWRFFADMARALKFLHDGPAKRQRGVIWEPMIHCDIKPENWLVDFESGVDGKLQPKLVLADFGLLHTRSELAALADQFGNLWECFGTPSWWAPECAVERLGYRYTRTADVYSMGACMQYLALGCGVVVRHPSFEELDEQELTQREINCRRRRLYLADNYFCRLFLADGVELDGTLRKGFVPVEKVLAYSPALANVVWLAMQPADCRPRAARILRWLEEGLQFVCEEDVPEWFSGEWKAPEDDTEKPS